jgi:hypothetical protein
MNVNDILEIGVNDVFSLLIKILLFLICILSLVLVRQSTLMARVVNVTINGWFKILAFGFMILCFVLTAIVMVM